jgi:putative transposase
MNNSNNAPRRQSLRLKNYNYALPGGYFLTLCTQHQQCVFGEIVDGVMQLNDAGKMLERWWLNLHTKFAIIQTDSFVVMPNHFHGIVFIADVGQGTHMGVPLRAYPVGANQRVRPEIQHSVRADPCVRPDIAVSIPTIVQWLKTMTTNDYIHGVKNLAWQAFENKLWQRNYYEHVIRDDASLEKIREYIVNNPMQWTLDKYHFNP